MELLRLMVSTGGRILPRPYDKILCYVGGETRIISVNRLTTLHNFTSRLTKTLNLTTPFIVKYQLPSEDLDSLISVITEEDFLNMIEEYDRVNSNSNNSCKRVRLFVFKTNNLEPGLTNNPGKSDEWFLSALNGVKVNSEVNSLLSLEDDDEIICLKEKQDGSGLGQYVHLIPGSPMMETTSSSFGSGSSMGLVGSPVVVSGSPVSCEKVVQKNLDPLLPYQQKQSNAFDLESVLSDFTTSGQLSPLATQATDPNDTRDQTPRLHMPQQQQIHHSPYLSPMPTTQIDTQHPQSHVQQLKLTHTAVPQPQYIHHQHPTGSVPLASYYQYNPHNPPMDQQNFVCYIPARQPPQGYIDAQPQGPQKTELSAGVYRPTNSGSARLMQLPSGRLNQPQYVTYSEIQQPSQSMYYATQAMTPVSAAQYQTMTMNPSIEASLQQQVRTAQR